MTFNANRVQKLIEQYREANTPQEKREIENQVLKATVWQNEDHSAEPGFAFYTEEELEKISEAMETDDEGVKALLRRPYLDRL